MPNFIRLLDRPEYLFKTFCACHSAKIKFLIFFTREICGKDLYRFFT